MFHPSDIVNCIDSDGSNGTLLVGKTYTIGSVAGLFVGIKEARNPASLTGEWSADRFRLVNPDDRDAVPATSAVTLDPADPFDAELIRMVEMNRRKRADYVSDESPSIFENFDRSDDQVGVRPGDSIEVLIATKQSRLRALRANGRQPNNEAEEDTLLDRAIYSVLALAKFRESGTVPE